MAYTPVPSVSTGDTWSASQHNTYVRDNFAAGVPDIFTTKGDLAVATAADTAARLAVGSTGAILVADSAAAAGVRWSSTGKTASAGFAIGIHTGATLTAAANSDSLYNTYISTTFATVTYTGLLAAQLVVDGSAAATGTGTIANSYSLYVIPPTNGTNNAAIYVTSGKVMIGDTSNAGMTTGLTINQGAADNEILALKSSDVGHSITSITEADTYGVFWKESALLGGLLITGLSEASGNPVEIEGLYDGTLSTTKSTAGKGAVTLTGYNSSAGSLLVPAANENIVVVTAGGTTRFILDADGDSHQDVGTSWTNYSTHDDPALLTALSVLVSKPDDPIRGMFGGFLQEHRKELEALKLVAFNEDGHHFVNMSKLLMLTVGAAMQTARQVAHMKTEIETLNNRLISAGA